MLEIRSLNKYYNSEKGKVHALKDINLTIGHGEIIGLFGENGAGKTSLLKSILGFHSYKGEILLDGKIIDRSNIGKLSFATCEHSFFPNLSPKEHKEFYQMHFGTFRLKRFEALMNFFELPMNKPLKAYSTGQKNQFEVIMALCQGAEYILMDEPFAGNDVFNREDFYKVLLGILEPEETIFLSTHLIEEVEHFISRAVLLKRGQLRSDVTTLELEDEGKSLMDYVKEMYHYRADRVSKALKEMGGEL
ncbi:MAG: ABC transporter ATP-binding protein [Lachnospiraceae bacterium]|nr:ABC transporter ATP-binding protein [Lachnospiraceae bacterium]